MRPAIRKPDLRCKKIFLSYGHSLVEETFLFLKRPLA